MSDTQELLKSIKIGAVELKNRVVMAPMTRCRATNEHQAPEQKHVDYYTQRASAGLIITEGSEVSKKARGYPFVAGIFNDAQVEGWKQVVDSVHADGGKIFMQLWHVGRTSLPDYHDGQLPWAPSAVNPETELRNDKGEKKQTVTPHAMSKEEIKQTVAEFGHAAANAKKAGFDGVEIHSSNGYLIHQFFNSQSNIRTDEYGGSNENKARFYFEVLEAVKESWPENRIGSRFNPSLHGVFGIEGTVDTIPFFDYLINRLNDYDLAYIHLSEPFTDVSDVNFLESDIAKHYRPIYKGNLMINSAFDRESGNKVIKEGYADLVAFGKLFISNPDLPHRFELKAETAEWDQDTFYSQGLEGYTDYPTFEEQKAPTI
ncbi:alkene reductase [Nonlabens marinus]|uniref:Flavoprotein NADH-dependent oxidoreductase n=1 Tax=Nonlabens marinus S1-08 TaxID=1454201 RepID=W8VU56_9FLAO|nr:alkene reductase [Nonlabens marinus]BAO54308.1 flavoprotein NADH-dependent oxidoreductase [Nonlabens marinus S1-08]